MSVILNGRTDLELPAMRVIRSAIDTGDGGTPRQRQLLDLLIHSFVRLPDLDIDELEPITPIEVAEIFDDEVAARRLRMLLVLFEVLRSPETREQVALVDGYAFALGGDDEGLRLIRSMVQDETEAGVEHLRMVWDETRAGVSEQTVLARYDAIDDAIEDPELAAQLRAMRDLPRGTLGREYIEFYLQNGFQIPGEGVAHPAFFVQHDMSHLLAGIGPTAPGELALSAFQVGMLENEAHWNQFLLGLTVYELGTYEGTIVESKTQVLSRDGAIEFLVESFQRGAKCVENYNDVSLLSLADQSIDDLRTRFGIAPPRDPFPEFTVVTA